MIITFSKASIKQALSVVSVALGNAGGRADLDLVSHVVFRPKSLHTYEMLTASKFIAASSMLPITTDEDDVTSLEPFTIEGKRLQKWLASLPECNITFNYESFITTATCDDPDLNGDVEFSSLNPEEFPFWDDELEASKTVYRTSTDRLKKAFSFSKDFTLSENETAQSPGYCNIQARNGRLISTDVRTVALVKMPEFESSSLRIRAINVGSMIKFLSSLGDRSVSMLEHERMFFLKTDEGDVFSVSKDVNEMPAIKLPTDYKFAYSVQLDTDILQRSLAFLAAAADSNQRNITWISETPKAPEVKNSEGEMEPATVPFTIKDHRITLKMEGSNQKSNHVNVKCASTTLLSQSLMEYLNGVPMVITLESLNKVLTNSDKSVITFEVLPQIDTGTKILKGGLIRVLDEVVIFERDSVTGTEMPKVQDSFTNIISWKKGD